MSRPIDEKIVKMTLDNDKFKTNVQETVQSFQSINDATQSVNQVDLSGIARSVAKIEERFSATGVVIASVIKNITDSAIDMGKKLYAATVDPLIEGGKRRSLNIEQAKFQFEGLGMDVEATMESALQAVKGTAYGLDEAAVVASQFGATGMEAGDEMTKALLGISGVAAMTGSSYSDIGNIFTTVAGNGRLMGNDLLRLGSRGVNAAATLANAMGITEAEVRKLVTAGEISFEQFAEVMSDAFGEHATKANETYTGSLSNLRAALGRIGASVYTPRFEQMRDIFNTLTPVVDDLNDALTPLIEHFNNFSGDMTKKLISSIKKIDFKKFAELGGMSNILQGFISIGSTVASLLGSLREGFSRVFSVDMMSLLVSATEGFERLTARMIPSEATASKLATIFQGVFAVFDAVTTIAWELAKAIFGIVPTNAGEGILDFLVYVAELAIAMNDSIKEGNLLTDVIKRIGGGMASIGDVIGKVISGALDLTQAIGEKLRPVLEWIRDALGPVGDVIKDTLGDQPLSMENILGGGVLFGIIVFIQKMYDLFLQVGFILEGFALDISGTFRRLGTALSKFIGNVKYNSLMKIAISIGILAISIKLLEGIPIENIASALGALVGSMAILAGGMMAIEKLNFVGGIRASITILAMAIAMAIMAGTLKSMANLDLGEIARGLAALAGMMLVLSLGIMAISAVGKNMKVGALQIVAMATAVLILVSAVERLKDIEVKEILKSIGAIGLIFLTMAGFLALTKGTKMGPGAALGLIGIATSLVIMSVAVEKIGAIDTEQLIKGLAAIAVLLAEIGIFSKLAGGPSMIAAGVGMTGIAVAMGLLMIPITLMSKMTWEELAKGLVGLAGALIAVGIAGTAASGSILGAVGILVMAAAMNALMPPILIFASMSWTALAKGIGGMALALGVLAAGALLLAPAAIPMLAFGAALLAIGLAVSAVGLGVGLLAVGITTLAALTITSITSIIGAMGLFIRGLGSLIPSMVKFAVDMITALIDGFMQVAPKVISSISTIVMDILRKFRDNIGEFIEVGADIVINVLDGIAEKAPDLIEAAFELLLSFITGMADSLEENGTQIVNAMMRLMGEVIVVVLEAGVAMIDALLGWIPGVKKVTGDIGETASEYIRDNFGAEEVANEKMDEFTQGIYDKTPGVEEAALAVATAGHDSASLVDFTDIGNDATEGMATGILGELAIAENASKTMAQASKDEAGTVDFTDTGAQATQEYASGVTGRVAQVENAARGVAQSGDKSAGRVSFASSGAKGSETYGKGITSKKKTVESAARGVANSAGGVFGAVSWYTPGSNATSSFASGILSQRTVAVGAARSVASGASGALGATLMIRSPSKVTTRIGEFFGEGFAKGIGSRIKNVSAKTKEMATNASSALKEFLTHPDLEDEELRLKIIVDDGDFDPDRFNLDPIDIRPNPRYTNGLVSTADDGFRQNRNNSNGGPSVENKTYNEYKYEIGVTAGGNMSRAEVKKLAVDVRTEIKNEDDKSRMGRGEEVIF